MHFYSLVALFSILVVGGLAADTLGVGSTSSSSCTGTPTSVPLTATGTFATLLVAVPTGSIVVQGVPGVAWSAQFVANSQRLNEVSFSSSLSGGVNVLKVTDTKPPVGSSASVSTPTARVVLALCAVVLLLSWSQSYTALSLGLIVTMPVVSLALPPAVYYCQRGTLVVTYPPGAQIFVNGARLPTCSQSAGGGAALNLQPFAGTPLTGLNTFWFASPSVLDLDMNGTAPETVICSSSCRVYDSALTLVQTLSHPARVYAPQCTVDLDGNDQADLVVASGNKVYGYEWSSATRQFTARSGFPVDLSGWIGNSEIRGMSCGDINFDGKVDGFFFFFFFSLAFLSNGRISG